MKAATGSIYCRDDGTCIYRQCFEASFDGLWVTDGQGYTLALNAGSERNYGITAADAQGRHVREMEDTGVFNPSAALLAIRQKQRVTVTQRTRSKRVTLVTGNPVLDKNGEVQLVICNSRDITEIFELQEQLQTTQEQVQLYHAELNELRQERLRTEGIVAASPAMDKVLRQGQRVAGVNATVLLLGETGVGKNLIARKIHQLSPRSAGPYLELNCGAIPETLLESELFGYEPGAFTGALREGKPGIFELANAGTLVLDEIGELPYHLQVKLLQVLQNGKVTRVGGKKERTIDVRVIAATNRNLKELIERGGFRMDLYYRLNVLTIIVPPLRERFDDIYPLAHYFLGACNRKYGVSKSISAAAADLLLRYPWPGNVRELANTIERLVIMGEEDVVTPASLPAEIRAAAPGPVVTAGHSFRDQVEAFERQLILDAVAQHGSATRAARALGISQSSALRRLRQE